ncbi:MAG: hypothetical protein ACLVJH_07925 [Faecalibacterium prausnitzii]
MQPSDEAAVLALWQSQHHDTEDFAKMVLERFAGMQNIYVADENDAIVATGAGCAGHPAGAHGQLPVRPVRRGQSAAGGPAGLPCAPTKSCGAQALP